MTKTKIEMVQATPIDPDKGDIVVKRNPADNMPLQSYSFYDNGISEWKKTCYLNGNLKWAVLWSPDGNLVGIQFCYPDGNLGLMRSYSLDDGNVRVEWERHFNRNGTEEMQVSEEKYATVTDTCPELSALSALEHQSPQKLTTLHQRI